MKKSSRPTHFLASKEGVFGEPVSAASVAGLIKCARKGLLKAAQTIVCVITGHGLKDPDTATKPQRPLRPWSRNWTRWPSAQPVRREQASSEPASEGENMEISNSKIRQPFLARWLACSLLAT